MNAPAGVSERFRAAARDSVDGPVESLPSRLAVDCREVLGADGVGLSLFSDDFRLPLGSSDPESARAEQLQFTAQQGPCWDAVRADVPLAVDGATIAERWPQFAQELVTQTSYRSVASVPLRLARRTGGALDVYFRDGDAARRFDTGDATAVAAHVADVLNGHSERADDPPFSAAVLQGPAWTGGESARRRNTVWIAAGMLVGDGVHTPDDGLALLRARAYSEGRTADDLAADLVERRRTPTELRENGPTDR